MQAQETIRHGAPREDALRPAVFDPADFEVVTYIDLQEWEDGGPGGLIREWEQDIVRLYGPARTLATMWLGFEIPDAEMPTEAEVEAANPLNTCDHCGAKNLRYVGVVKQKSTGQNFVFGSSCVNRAGLTDRAEFKLVQLKKLAAGRRERMLRAEQAGIFLNENADIREFLFAIPRGEKGEPQHSFDFVNKMDLTLNKWGALTERQAAALRKVIAKQPEYEKRQAEIAEREANKGPAPDGKQAVEGVIVKTKWQESEWGGALKMVVRLDNGSAVWATVPQALEYAANEYAKKNGTLPDPYGDGSYRGAVADLEGLRIRFTATFEVSDRDESFAFGKRPSKVAVLGQEKGES